MNPLLPWQYQLVFALALNGTLTASELLIALPTSEFERHFCHGSASSSVLANKLGGLVARGWVERVGINARGRRLYRASDRAIKAVSW